MDKGRFVVVGANAGIGSVLASRLVAAGAVMVDNILIGYPKDTRIIDVIDMPEIVVEGHALGRPYVSSGVHHYELTPIRRSRKHWHDLRAFLHREVKADRRRAVQAAQHRARLIRRRVAK